jgi:hypothetical protein
LLRPIVIDLPASARQAIVTHAADLDRFGFEIEDFGGSAIA